MDYFNAFQDFVKEKKIEKKPAIFFRDRATTYEELLGEAGHVAAALATRGVKKGNVVSIYMGNCKEFLSIFLGVAKCGAIAAPINILLTEYEVKPQLELTKAKAIFVSPAQLGIEET